MKKMKDILSRCKASHFALVAFIAAYAFFQFAYPYHLVRREQLDLFIYDWAYICQTYVGTGWLSRFVTDFLEQFFLSSFCASAIVSLLLTAIAATVYSICRKIIGMWPSLAVSAVFYFWSFMRETGNLYTTRYTFVVLAYLGIILIVLSFRKHICKLISFVLLIPFGVWAFGSPVHENYGKIWSTPKFEYERLVGLDVETARENWDKVLKLSEKDLYMREASYFYNLAHAMKGDLGDKLLEHSQGNAYDLLFRVTSEHSVFTNSIAGEAWYHIGDLSTAEQSAITTLQASPNHTGARFIKRLANIDLVKGNEVGARKYLGMLSKTLFYRRWALNVMPGHQDEETSAKYLKARARLDDVDFVHLGDVPRSILKGLLKVDPKNETAQHYLLCYDLMRYDLNQFMEDYSSFIVSGSLYREAALIWMSQQGVLSEQNATKYGIPASEISRMNSFGRFPDRYPTTYWYYYLSALN